MNDADTFSCSCILSIAFTSLRSKWNIKKKLKLGIQKVIEKSNKDKHVVSLEFQNHTNFGYFYCEAQSCWDVMICPWFFSTQKHDFCYLLALNRNNIIPICSGGNQLQVVTKFVISRSHVVIRPPVEGA